MGNTSLLTPKKMGRPRKKLGRPPKVNEKIVDKLLYAFGMGCTDTEACLHAGITPTTLYKYQEKNPKFADHKEALKENPVLQARLTVVKDLKNNVDTAKWFLERRRRSEFAMKIETDTNITINFTNAIPRSQHAISSVPNVIEAKTVDKSAS